MVDLQSPLDLHVSCSCHVSVSWLKNQLSLARKNVDKGALRAMAAIRVRFSDAHLHKECCSWAMKSLFKSARCSARLLQERAEVRKPKQEV
jgi:hypothetical protein